MLSPTEITTKHTFLSYALAIRVSRCTLRTTQHERSALPHVPTTDLVRVPSVQDTTGRTPSSGTFPLTDASPFKYAGSQLRGEIVQTRPTQLCVDHKHKRHEYE